MVRHRWTHGTLAILLAFGSLAAAQTYQESPEVAELVAAGHLPPVADRLPSNPKVVEHIESGSYGGRLVLALDRSFSTANWYSVDAGKVLTYLYEPLLTHVNPTRLTYEPNLAESWEVLDEGREIRFTLRQGVKWSDGTELTTEDVAFTYNDIILNENIPAQRGWAMLDGAYAQLVVEDDHRFRFVFAQPNPTFLDAISKFEVFPLMAKHEMARYHPDYHSDVDYADFDAARSYDSGPLTLSAWKIVAGGPSTVTLVRNPYYWKVDGQGKQLPYLDQVRMQGFEDRQALGLSVIAGDTDVAMDGTVADVLPTAVQQQDQRPYTVILEEIGWSYTGPMFNWDAPNPNLRQLFREQKFIDAVRFGVNREEIKDAIPLINLTYGVYPPPGTPYYEEEVFGATMYAFDPERANRLLDELGLMDLDGDGFRQYPEGYPDPGAPVAFQITAHSGDPTRLTAFEILAKQYRENLGIRAELMATPETRFWESWPYGEWEVSGRWAVLDSHFDDPLRLPRTFGVVGTSTADVPDFHTRGALEEPAAWEIETGELLLEAKITTDETARRALVLKALAIFAEKAPMDQLYTQVMWRAIPDEALMGNVPYYLWPERFNAGHGRQAQRTLEIEYWYRKK